MNDPSRPKMPPIILVQLLGEIHVRRTADTRVGTPTHFRTRSTAALLGYLAHHSDHAHPRGVLVEAIWPGAEERAGRKNLTTCLTSLRHLLEPPGVPQGSILITNMESVRLNPDYVTTDVSAFEGFLDAAERLQHRHPGDASIQMQRAELLKKAVDLYAGTFLPGHYQEWVVVEQERLTGRWMDALIWLAEISASDGQLDYALSLVRRAQTFGDPRAEELLARLSSQSVSSPSSRFASAMTTDTPTAPVKPAESSAGSFPPPGTTSAYHLALPVTTFFGRENELEQLRGYYDDHQIRLVTLTGPGGSGKTRFARQFVADLMIAGKDAPPVFAVDLTALDDANGMTEAVASALGLPGHVAAGDDGEASAKDAIIGTLSAVSRPLLLLDNVEQLLPGAADWIEDLLGRVPELFCLVTSRMFLAVNGEHILPVTPLETPEAAPDLPPRDLLKRWPSIALYVDRARAVNADFYLAPENAADVAHLVRYLEGLPLAIELAAARSHMLTPRTLLERLQPDRFEVLKRRGRTRHRSLRETIGWSVDLLTPNLKRRFAHLSVLRGSWTATAAAAVMGTSLAATYSDLEQMAEASLIRVDWNTGERSTVRYHMLETIREFAIELLAEDPADKRAAVLRHGAFYETTLVSHLSPLLQSDKAQWMEQVQRDQDNFHIALNRAAGLPAGDCDCQCGLLPARALSLAVELSSYWIVRGHILMGRSALRAALRRVEEDGLTVDNALLCKALIAAGALAQHQSDYHESRHFYQKAIPLTQESEPANRVRLGAIWNNLGTLASEAADYDEAWRCCSNSLEIWRELGELQYVGANLSNLGEIATRRNDFDTAHVLLAEALDIARANGDTPAEIIRLLNLSEVLFQKGAVAEAVSACRTALQRSADIDLQVGYAGGLLYYSIYTASRGDLVNATWIYEVGRQALMTLQREQPSFIQQQALRFGLIVPTMQANTTTSLSPAEATARILREGIPSANDFARSRPLTSSVS